MRRKSALSGSRGARSGAATAVKTISRPTSAESVLRREKRATSMARAFIGGSAVPDPRIEPGVAQVDQHVDADEDDGIEEDEILNDDDVTLDHRGDERAA